MTDTPTNIPKIKSLWRAKDGRRMRVTEVILTEHVEGGGWAKLDVLPPYLPRQRRSSQMMLAEFGRFLTEETGNE
jgi:hypothetical protein